MPYDFKFGSETAKGGFANENTIAEKFNNWKEDLEAQNWLKIMGYRLEEIEHLLAIRVPVVINSKDIKKFNLTSDELGNMKFKKADLQVQITLIITVGGALRIENLSLKKANDTAGFNQIDKRSVDSYREIWDFDETIASVLKVYTGEYNPAAYSHFLKVEVESLKDKRRAFLNEIKEDYVKAVIDFFSLHKILIVSDVIKGRGGLSADWILVTKFNVNKNTTTWILKEINQVLDFYGNGDVRVSKEGNLHIGKITMQRKGGTPDPTKIQFKINPNDLFELRRVI